MIPWIPNLKIPRAKKGWSPYWILLLLLFIIPLQEVSGSERAYITDTMKIPLRTGPTLGNRIIAFLSSGQALEVLEAQEDWTHVRTLDDGNGTKEGWALSRYLITRLPWEVRANSLLEENRILKEKLDHIEQKLNEAVHREQGQVVNLQDGTEALFKLEEEIETLKERARGFTDLEREHRATLLKLKAVENDLQATAKEKDSLETSQVNRWFATGALVLLCGLMIGLVVGRQQKKRKSSRYY